MHWDIISTYDNLPARGNLCVSTFGILWCNKLDKCSNLKWEPLVTGDTGAPAEFKTSHKDLHVVLSEDNIITSFVDFLFLLNLFVLWLDKLFLFFHLICQLSLILGFIYVQNMCFLNVTVSKHVLGIRCVTKYWFKNFFKPGQIRIILQHELYLRITYHLYSRFIPDIRVFQWARASSPIYF